VCHFVPLSDRQTRADCRYRFAYAVLAANQLVAVSNTVKFRYDDGTTFLSWRTGEEVDHAVWFIVFLILVTLFNLLRVKVWTSHECIGLQRS
jgi:amino acid transporter